MGRHRRNKRFSSEAGDPACARKKNIYRRPISTPSADIGLIHD
jgi:hypothetical protein